MGQIRLSGPMMGGHLPSWARHHPYEAYVMDIVIGVHWEGIEALEIRDLNPYDEDSGSGFNAKYY